MIDLPDDVRQDLLRARLSQDDVVFRVGGGSMAPALHAGDRLVVRSAARRRPAPGDVVVLESGGGFIAHRVVWRAGSRAVTCGDANWIGDAPRRLDEYVGVAIGYLPRGSETMQPIPKARARVARGLVVVSLQGAARILPGPLRRTLRWAARRLLGVSSA